MEIPSPDPRVAVLGAVAASVASPRVRHAVGSGIGYAARTVMTLGAPVAAAGRDIYDSAREVASPEKPATS